MSRVIYDSIPSDINSKLDGIIHLELRDINYEKYNEIFLTEIKTLLITNCKIDKFDKNLLSNVKNIDTLIIKDCLSIIIQIDAFTNFINLQHLSIQNCDLNRIPSAIKQLKKLEYINLSNNRICCINCNDFDQNINLIYINLSNNFIFNINIKSFINNKIEKLNIENNDVIDYSFLKHSQSLKYLNIKNNIRKFKSKYDLPDNIKPLKMYKNIEIIMSKDMLRIYENI